MTLQEIERLAVVETKQDSILSKLSQHIKEEDVLFKSVAAVLILGLGAIIWLFQRDSQLEIKIVEMKSEIAAEVVKQLDMRWTNR